MHDFGRNYGGKDAAGFLVEPKIMYFLKIWFRPAINLG